MYKLPKRLNKLLACFLAALLLMSNLAALVPVYAAASANTSEETRELPAITIDKQVEDQSPNKQNADMANLTTQQKVVQFVNQLIPYYAQNGKQQGPEWLRTTDINFTFTEDFKPMYSLETLQPFTKEVVDGKFGFWQGRYAYQSGATSTANLGIGLRWLSEDKTSLTGVNTFYDYAFKHNLSRVGVGAEYFNKQAEYRANFYIPTSGDRQTGATALTDGMLYSYIRAVSGFDYEVGTSLEQAPWLSFYASGFHYDNKHKEDENGYRLRSKMQLTPRLSMEMGYTNSNLASGSLYGKVLYQLADTAGPALRGGSAKELSNDISYKLLQKVQRENDIKTETFTKLVAYTGNLSVTVTNSSGIALQGAQVQAYQNGSPVGAAAATYANGIAVLSGLAAGEYTVRATYFSVSGTSSAVTVQKDQTASTGIALAVLGGKALINVLDNAGAGVSGATVTAEATDGLHGTADKSLFDRILGVKTAYAASAFTVTAVTDAKGIASFNNLPPGNYKFMVTVSGKEMKSLAVAVPDGSTSNATVVLPTSGGNIVAMISDAVTKAAIYGATVVLENGSNVIETKTTGSDGTVVFSGLTAGSNYTVTASADNYTSENTSTTVTDKETVAAAIALTPQAGGANITVKDDSNVSLSGATVSVTVNGQPQMAVTDANGVAAFANLPAGTYTFTATKADYNSNTASVTITGGSIAAVDVTLTRQTGSATITVTDGDNRISGITVSVEVNGQEKTETTNAQGEATFTSIPTGQYTFTATSGFASETAVVTIEADGIASKTISLPAMGSVDFIVTNGSGAVSGAKISVTVNGNQIDKYSGADGKASFANLPVGNYTFDVTCTGYESKSQSVTIARNTTGNVPLTINKIITAQVNVKDSAGNKVQFVSVRITGNGVDRTETTDRYGDATFSLPAGTYTFTATRNEYNDVSQNIRISDENKSVNLTIVHKVGSVTFIVKDRKGQLLSGVNISLTYPVEVSGTTDGNGKLTLTNLPTNETTQLHLWFNVSKDIYYQGVILGVIVKEGPNNVEEIVLPSTKGKAKVTVKSGTTTLQGATVTMEGGISKNTNLNGNAFFEYVSSGEVVFSASMSGYTSNTVTATIAPGNDYNDPNTEVEITLAPLDP